jgi:hypothetical protein
MNIELMLVCVTDSSFRTYPPIASSYSVTSGSGAAEFSAEGTASATLPGRAFPGDPLVSESLAAHVLFQTSPNTHGFLSSTSSAL